MEDLRAEGLCDDKDQKLRLVIIGASFAGLRIAKGLQDMCHVTVVEPRDYWEYSPGMVHVLCGSGKEHELVLPLSHVLQESGNFKVTWRRAICRQWSDAEKVVFIQTIESVNQDNSSSNAKLVLERVPFDVLVLATGLSYSCELKPGSVYCLTDRLQQLHNMRRKLLEPIVAHEAQPTTIIIYGGGLIGVELAAEIASRQRSAGRRVAICLISRSLCLSSIGPHAGVLAEKHLQSLGVSIVRDSIIKCSKVSSASIDYANIFEVTTASKRTLLATAVINCTGTSAYLQIGGVIEPHVNQLELNLGNYIDNKNGFDVNEHFQLIGRSSVFAVGDCANIVTARNKRSNYSGAKVKSAFLAEHQASLLVDKLRRLQRDGSLSCAESAAVTPPLIAVVSLGPHRALLVFNDIVLGDWVATAWICALIKMIIEYTKVAEIRGKRWARLFWWIAHIITDFANGMYTVFNR